MYNAKEQMARASRALCIALVCLRRNIFNKIYVFVNFAFSCKVHAGTPHVSPPLRGAPLSEDIT